jgi:hypothetical protein
MRLPDVIGIGTRRCGSSWLHHVLNNHPGIGKPRSGLHFFSSNYSKGLSWYGEQLAAFSSRPVLLEFSVSYMYPEDVSVVADRMAHDVPDARLFVCVRDPIARAWSDYLRSVRMGEIDKDMSFEAAVAAHPVLLERGRYGRLLAPFRARFGDQRIRILLYDDLQSDGAAYLGDLLQFIGLDRFVDPSWMDRSEPAGKGVRYSSVDAVIRGVKSAIDKGAERAGLGDRWNDWKGRHVRTYERLLELNRVEVSLPTSAFDRLRDYFADDIRELATLAGRNLEHWSRG